MAINTEDILDEVYTKVSDHSRVQCNLRVLGCIIIFHQCKYSRIESISRDMAGRLRNILDTLRRLYGEANETSLEQSDKAS